MDRASFLKRVTAMVSGAVLAAKLKKEPQAAATPSVAMPSLSRYTGLSSFSSSVVFALGPNDYFNRG